ncbi:MAG: FkbM family methyltransferase [Parcubacteria group bacterium]|nr:FkbM family methyltransferase [Parcubacteria group bacterium]
MRKEELLAAFDSAVAKTPRLMVAPEYMGTGLAWQMRRLARYRGVYAQHLWEQLRMRLGLVGTGDAPARTFWGREMTLPARDSNASIIRQYTTLFPEEDGLTRFLIRELTEDSVFYDIGANYGYYTALAAELVTTGEIHAFEPSERVFPYLSRGSSGGDHLFLNKVALSDSSGEVSFFDCSPDNASGQSTLVEAVATHEHPEQYATTTVTATTLDAYGQTHRAPTIIKLDVEGGESAVLAGARTMLTTQSPVVAVELWSGEGSVYSVNVLRLFDELGYEPFFILPSGELKRTTRAYLEDWLTERRAEMNFVFKK